MTLFWIGVAIFFIGIIIRYFFKYRYYSAYRNHAHTELQKKELKSIYRPRIFYGLGIQCLGCIIAIIALLIK